MAERYFRVDVAFFHKRTCNALWDKFGPAAPLLFLSLIARAKDGTVPGLFSYSSEAIALEKLGVESRDLGFTLDEFFTVTGRLKQTSRRRNGPVWNVYLTRYGQWQQDSKRYEAAVRKSRSRAQSERDTKVTGAGHNGDTTMDLRTTSTTTPKPPRRRKPKAAFACHLCGAVQQNASQLEDHLEYVHAKAPV